MAIYFCNLALDFTDATGDPAGDGSGDVYTGPGGLQAAVEGWGNATALDAGDTIYLKGTADLSKLVKITVDDNKSGSWVISDVVQNHNDGGGASGDDWVGELVFIDATTVWVQINAASSDYASVDTADGIDNTTQAETIAGANMTAKACPGIQIDNNVGSTASGAIHLMGCDASWVARADQAVLDGDLAAANCVLVGVAIDFVQLDNLTLQKAAGHGLEGTFGGNAAYWVLRQCSFSDNGGDGIYYIRLSNWMHIQCVFENNTGNGCGRPSSQDFMFCRMSGNGGFGASITSVSHYVGCIMHDNTSGAIQTSSFRITVMHCVLDGTGGGGDGLAILAADYGTYIIANRICNNAGYGINQADANNDANIEDWNVFYGNNGGGAGKDTLNIIPGLDSYGSEGDQQATSDGYDAAGDDFNVEDGKELDSLAINLDWDA